MKYVLAIILTLAFIQTADAQNALTPDNPDFFGGQAPTSWRAIRRDMTCTIGVPPTPAAFVAELRAGKMEYHIDAAGDQVAISVVDSGYVSTFHYFRSLAACEKYAAEKRAAADKELNDLR